QEVQRIELALAGSDTLGGVGQVGFPAALVCDDVQTGKAEDVHTEFVRDQPHSWTDLIAVAVIPLSRHLHRMQGRHRSHSRLCFPPEPHLLPHRLPAHHPVPCPRPIRHSWSPRPPGPYLRLRPPDPRLHPLRQPRIPRPLPPEPPPSGC